MTHRQRLLLTLGAAGGAMLVGLGILVTRTWESPALTRAVLGALSGDGLTVAASRVQLHALRGVVVQDAQIEARMPDGILTAQARELVLTHRWSRLLAGEIAVKAITLRRPEVDMAWTTAAAPRPAATAGGPGSPSAEETTAAAPEGEGWSLAVAVERITVEDGQLVMREEGVEAEMVRLEGFNLELDNLTLTPGAASALLAATGTGRFSASDLVTPDLVATKVRADLSLANGHLEVRELQLPAAFGTIEVAKLDLNLGSDPYTYTLEGGGNPLVTAVLVGASTGFGDGTLRFAFAGDGGPKGGPRGDGTIAVAAGTLGDLPLLSAIELILAGTELVGRPYQPFVIPFTLDGDHLTLGRFTVDAGGLAVHAGGLVDLTGPLDLQVEITLPREDVDVAEIPKEVLDALTDVDRRVKLPIRIRGTLEAPKARFDSRAWAGLVGRRLANEAGRLLSGLFGDDRED